MGGRAGGGGGAGFSRGRAISFAGAGGFSKGLSDADRADLTMWKNTGSSPAEIKAETARRIAANKKGAANVSKVRLTGKAGSYNVSWNDGKGNFAGSWSLGSDVSLSQAKKFANVIKHTGHSGLANYHLTH